MNVSCGTVSEIYKSTSSLIKKTPRGVLGATALVGVMGLAWFGGTQRGRKQAKVTAKAVAPLLKTGACLVGEGISWTKLSEDKAVKMRKALEKAKG